MKGTETKNKDRILKILQEENDDELNEFILVDLKTIRELIYKDRKLCFK